MGIDPDLTLGAGRAAYFEENRMSPDGGYDDAWVVIRVGAFPVFAFPNTASRKRDVPLHDLHHVLTGYGTSLLGEAEIGAWELGSDCRASPAAVFLNCQVFGVMLPRNPRRLFWAFMRGRRARNLYGTRQDDALLSRSIREVRETLRIGAPVGEPAARDHWAFVGWSARALAMSWGPLVVIAALGGWIWG